MIKHVFILLLLCGMFDLKGHIRFLNTTNQNLFIIDVQLKKSYSVDQNQEIILMTTARASHFLIYSKSDETTDNQKDELPLFSFGTTDHMLLHPIPTITPENLMQSDLPENIHVIPSSIKRTQAVNLITKPITHCSKCAERKKAQAQKAQTQTTH